MHFPVEFLRRWWPWILLAVVLLCLAFQADAHVGWLLDGPRPKFLRRLAQWISHLGDWPSLVIGAAVMGFLGLMLRRRWTRLICLMVIAASMAGLLANASRCLTGRTRPSSELSQGWYGPPVSKKHRLARHSVNSFPSAHTTTAMAFFVTLLLLAPETGIWLLPAPLLIGASRLYLGVHHFSDVCAGWILGTVVALITCRMLLPNWIHFRNWWRSLPLPDLGIVQAQS